MLKPLFLPSLAPTLQRLRSWLSGIGGIALWAATICFSFFMLGNFQDFLSSSLLGLLQATRLAALVSMALHGFCWLGLRIPDWWSDVGKILMATVLVVGSDFLESMSLAWGHDQ